MPTTDQGASAEQPPAWAHDQATDELYDEQDADAIADRAREIADAARQRADEKHDEYDDPDQGGEA